MRQVFEKIKQKLDEHKEESYKAYSKHSHLTDLGRYLGAKEMIKIVDQVAEEYSKASVENDLVSRSDVIKIIENEKKLQMGYTTDIVLSSVKKAVLKLPKPYKKEV